MPPHTHYCEPFFGSGAVLFAKDPENVSEVINDLNGTLINFWRVLQCPVRFPLFVRQVQAIPFGEDFWGAARMTIHQWEQTGAPIKVGVAPSVEIAVSFFVLCRQSMAGRMTSFAPLSKTRTRRGFNEQASAWLSAVEGLPEVHARLKRVVVLGPKPAVDVIKQQDGPGTLFYCDSPYPASTRTSKDTYGQYEMTDKQHQEYLLVCRNCVGKVMISGYNCALYDSMLNDWRRVDFDLPNNSASGKEKRRMVESVWMNY